MNAVCRITTEVTDTQHALKAWGCCWFVSLLLMIAGCQMSSGSQRKTDSTLQRHVKDASQAYSEGHIEQAIDGYRKAIRRAWAMDDPYESGTAAYNLAACLMSDSRFSEAQDWLLDARVELHRAGASAGNVWLLEAKLAQIEGRFEDVSYLVQRAACSEPPCPDDGNRECCGDDDPCGDRCVARLPCLGPKLKQRRAARDCRDAYQAQIHLLRARSAAEQYDIATAQSELARACELAEGICGYDLHAELHNVAALIHIAKGEYLQAGRHLDREAENLRWAGNYREIPTALELASAAYQQAGQFDLAADRLCRVARILYGRGDADQAWSVVQLAVPVAELTSSETERIRLSLLANEILLVLSEQGDAPPEIRAEPDLGMLAPTNTRPDDAMQDAAMPDVPKQDNASQDNASQDTVSDVLVTSANGE